MAKPPLSALAETDALFFGRAGLDRAKTEQRANEALQGADDGELFLEYRQSEALTCLTRGSSPRA